MSDTFLIRGGRPLGGTIAIRGSKNAALPLIAACLLTEERCVLTRVPAIADVDIMIEICRKLGAQVAWDEESHRLEMEAQNLHSAAPDEALSRKLRGSVLFAGALLGRLRRVSLAYPGGDAIGSRPLGAHFHAFEALGADIREEALIEIDGARLAGAPLLMDEPSVTATENAILAAVLAPGKTVISLGALEPHVQELIELLRAMGADIRVTDFFRLEINGVERLHGAEHEINPDELEVSGFATLAAATRSDLTLKDIRPAYLDAVFLQLKKMGVSYTLDRTGNTVDLNIRKPGSGYRHFRIQSGLYPKLGSDHIPPFVVLATQAEGSSLVHDWLYENRLRYVPELQKMGATCEVLDPHRALITGPTVLAGCAIESMDIRSGMTLVIAGLVAQGKTVISNIGHIDRGYERLEERLQDVGADIERA